MMDGSINIKCNYSALMVHMES